MLICMLSIQRIIYTNHFKQNNPSTTIDTPTMIATPTMMAIDTPCDPVTDVHMLSATPPARGTEMRKRIVFSMYLYKE